MHEILHLLAANGPPATPDNSVKIAIITAVSVVIAAAITAISATFTRRHTQNDGSQHYVDELVRRAEVAERRCVTLESTNQSLTSRVDDLEAYCWRAGVDPTTGKQVPSSTRPKGTA